MSEKETVTIRVKVPFGFKNTRIEVLPDGKRVYYWKLRWWYAIYQSVKMAVQTCFSAEIYSEHNSEELENMDK